MGGLCDNFIINLQISVSEPYSLYTYKSYFLLSFEYTLYYELF